MPFIPSYLGSAGKPGLEQSLACKTPANPNRLWINTWPAEIKGKMARFPVSPLKFEVRYSAPCNRRPLGPSRVSINNKLMILKCICNYRRVDFENLT